MKKIDNRQNGQAQRVCGRPYSATVRSTGRRNKLSIGAAGAKAQKRSFIKSVAKVKN